MTTLRDQIGDRIGDFAAAVAEDRSYWTREAQNAYADAILALLRTALTSDAAVEALCSVVYGPSNESLYPSEKPWAFDDLRRALTAALDAITTEATDGR